MVAKLRWQRARGLGRVYEGGPPSGCNVRCLCSWPKPQSSLAQPKGARASAWPQRNTAKVRFSRARLVTVRGGRIWVRLAGVRVAEAGSHGKVKPPPALSTPAKSVAYKYCCPPCGLLLPLFVDSPPSSLVRRRC